MILNLGRKSKKLTKAEKERKAQQRDESKKLGSGHNLEGRSGCKNKVPPKDE